MTGRDPLQTLLGSAAVVALSAAATPAAAEAQAFRLRAEHVLGTSLDLVAAAPERAVARAAADAARAEIARLDALLSGWRDDSELARLNRSEALAVSPELYAVVDAAERWRTASGGAFDARLGEVERLWRRAADTGVEPSEGALQAALAAAREPVTLDPDTRTIRRPRGVTLALDAVAKGYVVDRALEAALAAAPELRGLMLDIGGDLRCWGESPAGGWTVEVADPAELADNAAPAALLRIRDGAVAMSGRGARDLNVGGRPCAHLLSPADGRPAGAASAAVFAPLAADADALATALTVMPLAEGLALVERTPGAEALILTDDGARHGSSGWQALTLASAETPRLIRTAAAAPAAAPAAAAWPAGFSLTVDYVLPRPTEAKVYSPYVVIWVTDESNRLVRTLLMQGDDLDWIDQNYIWWRRYGRARPELTSKARPTRPAGRYSAVWDGRDDAGRPVGQGRYVIHLEAIRENGGHSYQTVTMTLGAQAASGSAAADEELGATSLRYGPRR